jgi:hypothetical protein
MIATTPLDTFGGKSVGRLCLSEFFGLSCTKSAWFTSAKENPKCGFHVSNAQAGSHG